MSGGERGLGLRAAELRRAFDRSFADAPHQTTETLVDLLAIRVAGDPYVVRLADVAGLFVDRVVTPLPTRVPDLLGIAGFRVTLVPVYDLRPLLGYSTGGAPRWMISTVGEGPIAFAFDLFEEHLRVPHGALTSDDSRSRRYVQDVARAKDGARPIVHIPSLVKEIAMRARQRAAQQEPP